ncbi:MAG: ion transporter, partial [Lactobacillus sp.]|nr:ion transporter [Lactobacillus sp.]
MAILAVISIILVILDYASVINLDTGVWMWIDNGILVVFAIDYFYRLTIA